MLKTAVTSLLVCWCAMILCAAADSLQNPSLLFPLPDEEALASRRDRDTYDLYERNRDLTNWDVRDNWRYQKRSFLRGNTRIDPNNFRTRRVYTRDRYSPPPSDQSYYRPR